MDGYTILHETLSTALKQAGEESGMLLGQSLEIALADSLKTSKTAFFSGIDDACFVIAVESREEYPGQFYLLFSLRDAIVLSSILLGIPAARIQEKKRLSIIENDDLDAFAEIANMINGALNTVFQNTLPQKVHLKLLSPKKFVPDVDQISEQEPFPDGEYLMFRSKLEMPDQEMSYLDVLIPEELGNLFDPPQLAPPVEEEPVSSVPVTDESDMTSGDVDLAAAGAEGEPGTDTVVVLEDDPAERQELVEMLAFTGYQVVGGELASDIKELFTGKNVRLVLIGSRDADEHELAVCIKVKAYRQNTAPPIIMSAQRWTRTAVLKALKFGAREIILKPYNKDELTAKVKICCR